MKLEYQDGDDRQEGQTAQTGRTSHAQTLSPTLPQAPDMQAAFNRQSAKTQRDPQPVPLVQKAFEHLEPHLVPRGDMAGIRAAAERQVREQVARTAARLRHREIPLTPCDQNQKTVSGDKLQAARVEFREQREKALDRNEQARQQERTY